MPDHSERTTSSSAACCRWCGAEGDEPHDGATHDAYAAEDPPGVGYNAPGVGYNAPGNAAFVSPYCDHPECHNAHTSDYGECGTGVAGFPMKMCQVAFLGGGGITRRLGRRWCRSHALINEGWSFG